MLKIKSLTKEYLGNGNDAPVLKNIDLKVERGEFVAIVGPSGCGKTTLLRCVAGLDKDFNGSVEFEGKTKGMVFQNFSTFPWLTVRKNIEFALGKSSLQERNTLTEQWLLATGLRDFKNYYPKDLSGGMNQRVAIAAALAPDPDLVLLDEPFGALDSQTRSLMQEQLLAALEANRPAVLLVTHDVDEAIYLADKIYVMSARPGEIKTEVRVELPRDRHADLKLSEEFLEIKKQIHFALRSESIKAAQFRVSELNKKSIRIGLHAWAGVTPFYHAQDKGDFFKEGLELELVPLEKDEDRIKAFREGRIDLLHLTVDSLDYLNKVEKIDCGIALLMDNSAGADALVANGNIGRVEELVGKKIGVEAGLFSQFFLERILAKHGMTVENINLVNLKGSEIGSSLLNKKIDAAILWEPWLSSVLGIADARILASTATEKNLIISALIARKSFIKNNQPQLAALKKVWQNTIDGIGNPNNKTLLARLAAYLGISLKEFERQLGKFEFIGRGNEKFFRKQARRVIELSRK